MADIQEYKCPNCGGILTFEPGTQKMKCPYCDSEIDVQTALNTGMDCICVTWGFRSADFLESLHPLALISTPSELLSFL